MSTSSLFNTTYQVHRLSPLHVGTRQFTSEVLAHHASHIRDLLTGSTIRGVRIGLTGTSSELSKAGALLNVAWTFASSEQLGVDLNDDSDDQQFPGLTLQLIYERTTYTVLFLRSSSIASEEGWEKYPLLLIRMPAHLASTIRAYLESSFDCNITQVSFQPKHIIGALETYLQDLLATAPTQMIVSRFENLIRDIQLTLSINLPSQNGCLKAIELSIPKQDILQFLQKGQALADVSPGVGSDKIGSGALLLAIQHYIKHRMAFDISHSTVQITKVACGGFVIGDGRVKIFPPSADEAGTSEDSELYQWVATKRKARYHLIENLLQATRRKNIENTTAVSPVL